ncbi:hypothetical protein ACIA5D_27250 [Actinoplanes sp. NPDC051513]|uniref:hypothetical protein n=1 Tax=Actinoplanes sp. NPDC051513 TaxID=3363908 RepID=UPI0037B3A612
MTQPRPEMACANCLTPLNTLGDSYIHPVGFRPGHGHQPVPVPVTSLDTVRRTCDFCGDPHPVWTITGDTLTAVITSTDGGLVQNYGDRWATCALCYQDITQHRLDRISQRALRLLPTLEPGVQARVTQLHRSFLTGLQPGRALITTTAWPHTTITARDLPRIRDRLLRLLRGTITLPAHLSIDRPELADRLEQSRLYWVDPTFTNLATAATPRLPNTALHPSLIPGDVGILAWAEPIGHTAAITWSTHDTAIHLVRYRTIGSGLDQHVQQHIREDIGWLAPISTHILPLDAEINPRDHAGIAVTLATWLLMGQQVAESPAADLDKPTRKRYTRSYRPLPDVRLVRLRTADQAPPGGQPHRQPADRATPAERVWVTGHWRAQPYGPGRTLRRPVYIHPHLRGPDDAPIKLSTTVRVLANPPASTNTNE